MCKYVRHKYVCLVLLRILLTAYQDIYNNPNRLLDMTNHQRTYNAFVVPFFHDSKYYPLPVREANTYFRNHEACHSGILPLIQLLKRYNKIGSHELILMHFIILQVYIFTGDNFLIIYWPLIFN